MSEIDPQFEHPQIGDPLTEGRLTEAMRRLAASSRQGAPAEIGADLAMVFRRHHARRRRIRYASMAGLVACFLAIAGLLFLQTSRTPRSAQNAAQNATQAHIEPAQTPTQAPEGIQKASIPAEKPRAVRKLSRPPKITTSTVAYSREFVALPGYDPEVPAEDLHIVRVQLPTSTLWQMGAPINPVGPERRVLADFVISQDGTPYGVRLVHTTIF